MPGSFNLNALPERPGAYINFKAKPQTLVPPTVGSVVAVPFVHTWGPENAIVLMDSMSDFSAVYGDDLDSAGWRAVRQAFVGEAVRGRRGAGQVVGYRMVASGGAQAAHTFQNTAGSPASALTIKGIYKGTRGNDLRITLQTDPSDGTKKDLIVLDGANVLETYVYAPTDLASLVADVNARSNWVIATLLVDGVTLAAVSATALTGGNDGSTLIAGDWTALMTAMEAQRFDYLAPYDLTDGSIQASMKTWGQNANAKGRRFFTLSGGAAAEVIGAAVTRAGTFNDPDFITLGVGSIQDNVMVDSGGEPVVLSTSQFVPRLAGILAALGENRDLSGARVYGVELIGAADEAGIDAALDAGVNVLSLDSDPDAPVHFERGLTTYTTNTNDDVPYLIFRNPKFVRTMHDFQVELDALWASNYRGLLPVNSSTRSQIVADAKRMLQAREDNGALNNGWDAQISSNPPPSDLVEYIAIDVQWAFGRSALQLLTTVTMQ